MRQDKFKKAMLLYQEKSFNEAIPIFLDIVEEGADNVEAVYQLGMCNFHIGRLDDAIVYFDRAVIMQPNKPYRYASRAYVRDKMGDLEGAVADYEKAISLDPDDAISYNNLGMLLEKMGRSQQASKMVKQADKLAASEAYQKRQREQVSSDEGYHSFLEVFEAILFTKRGRKEFFQFIKNGFKLKS